MRPNEFRELLRRYADGTCTKREKRFLEDWVLRNPISNKWAWGSEGERVLMGMRIKRAIDERRRLNPQTRVKKLWYVSIAASLLIAFGVWGAFFNGWDHAGGESLVISETAPYPADGIRLTLADGSVVSLDSVKSGLVGDTGDVLIRKLNSGELIYEVVGTVSPLADRGTMSQNTIHVPNGKQLQLTLPDGTRVWMNAATALTYPTAFTGSERKVTLDGEAYFEVAHNEAQPFKVVAHEREITVTGTHFNVSAYATDGFVRTTLLEGGVDINHRGKLVSLTPGFEAVSSADGKLIKQAGHLEQAMAWKNGYFLFENMDIASIMRSVARWYDITVVMDNAVSTKKFGGTFPIDASVDDLLNDLGRLAGITFEKHGKEVRIR